MSTSEITETTSAEHAVIEDEGATRAFDELRLEGLNLREDIDRLSRRDLPDYSATLGEVKKTLSTVSQRLGKLEEAVVSANPARHPELLAERARLILREPLLQFERACQAMEHTEQRLAALIGAVKQRAEQRAAVLGAVGVGVVAGLLLCPLTARFLPFGLNTHVAALIMGSDRWRAGSDLLQASDPEGWDALKRTSSILQANYNAIQGCLNGAAKTHRAQPCNILVQPP